MEIKAFLQRAMLNEQEQYGITSGFFLNIDNEEIRKLS